MAVHGLPLCTIRVTSFKSLKARFWATSGPAFSRGQNSDLFLCVLTRLFDLCSESVLLSVKGGQ